MNETIGRPYADTNIWVCTCGNEPCDYGFQPVDANGKPILCDDGAPADDGPFWRCGKDNCGRIYTPEGRQINP